MAKASRVGDTIIGSYSEHCGHVPGHSGILTGDISNGASTVNINGVSAAIVGSSTNEFDSCCGGSSGSISGGSSTVFICCKPAARIGDAVSPHTGSAVISSGSDNVNIG